MIRLPKHFKTKHLESSGFPNALKQSRLPKCFKTKHVECSGLPNALKQSIWRAQASQMLQNKAAGAKQNTAGSVLAADEKPPLVCLAPNNTRPVVSGAKPITASGVLAADTEPPLVCLAPNNTRPVWSGARRITAAGVSAAHRTAAGVRGPQTKHRRHRRRHSHHHRRRHHRHGRHHRRHRATTLRGGCVTLRSVTQPPRNVTQRLRNVTRPPLVVFRGQTAPQNRPLPYTNCMLQRETRFLFPHAIRI